MKHKAQDDILYKIEMVEIIISSAQEGLKKITDWNVEEDEIPQELAFRPMADIRYAKEVMDEIHSMLEEN